MRVSATDIDALRYFKTAEHEDADAEAAALVALIAQLRREGGETPAMAMGKALHKALELATAGEFAELEADGYRFQFPTNVEIDLPDIREIKATKEIVVDGVHVTLVGKVDAIDGLRVDDHKATLRFDPERFLSSMQWRIYLWIFEATHFRWNVFELFQGAGWDPRLFEVRNLHPINQFAYPGMAEDCIAAVREFIEFARVHLPERFITAEAA